MNKLVPFINATVAPDHFDPYQLAIWHDARGDWEAAHHTIQDLAGKKAAHLHAYLHRKEGDTWNADYWYQKAGRKRPDVSLQEELNELVDEYF